MNQRVGERDPRMKNRVGLRMNQRVGHSQK